MKKGTFPKIHKPRLNLFWENLLNAKKKEAGITWDHFWLYKIDWFHRFTSSMDTGCKMNVHKTFRRNPRRLLNILCMFSLRPASRRNNRHKVLVIKNIFYKDYCACSCSWKYFLFTDNRAKNRENDSCRVHPTSSWVSNPTEFMLENTSHWCQAMWLWKLWQKGLLWRKNIQFCQQSRQN